MAPILNSLILPPANLLLKNPPVRGSLEMNLRNREITSEEITATTPRWAILIER